MPIRGRVLMPEDLDSFPEVLDFSPEAMDKCVVSVDSVFRQHEVQVFATEGAAGGTPWPDLSPQYKAQKRSWLKRHGRSGGQKILVLTGDMRKSFVQTGHGDHLAYWFKASDGKRRITVGSQHRLAGYHAPGAGHNPRLPERHPAPMTDEALTRCLDVIWDVLIPYAVRYMRAKFRNMESVA